MIEELEGAGTWAGRFTVIAKYRGLCLKFQWYCETLWLATDHNGDVWAYKEKPSLIGSNDWWECNSETSYEEPVHYFYTDVSDWADSLVEYKL